MTVPAGTDVPVGTVGVPAATHLGKGWAHPLVSMKAGQTYEHWWPAGERGPSACRRYARYRGTLQAVPKWDNWNSPCATCTARMQAFFPQVRQTHGRLCRGCSLRYAYMAFRFQRASGRRPGLVYTWAPGTPSSATNAVCTCCDLALS